MGDVVKASKRSSYWLLAKNGRNCVEVLTTGLPGGQRALPVFSFREEAEMFLCLRNSREEWKVRETSAGELLSMLYTILADTERVTLDPLPENFPHLDTSELLSIKREAFMARLEETNGGHRMTGLPVLAGVRPARKNGYPQC